MLRVVSSFGATRGPSTKVRSLWTKTAAQQACSRSLCGWMPPTNEFASEERTKEAKVPGVNDCRCIRFPREVIECRKAATDVCYAEDPALSGIEDFCLGIYLILRLGVGRGGGTGRRGSRAREGLHFEEEGEEEGEYDGGEDADAELAERTTSTQGCCVTSKFGHTSQFGSLSVQALT